MKGIYIITNNINGKRYVGLSRNIKQRFLEHRAPKNVKNKTTNLAKAFRKYGLESFSFEILEEVEDENNLFIREMFWIERLDPEYNMNNGGIGNLGHKVNKETKQKISIKNKNNWAMKSEEDKQKIIKNLKRPAFGRVLKEETKEKLRRVNIGKKQSKETIEKRAQKISVSMVGNKNGNKSIIATSVNDGSKIEFNSSKEASIFFNVHPTCITGVLKGRRNSSKGYKFKYKNK